MANQGNLTFPYEVVTPDLLLGEPVGALVDVELVASPDGVTGTLTNRFPVPPTAGGFCVDVDTGLDVSGLDGAHIIVGALLPEGDYLEPTIGQIWPRIG